MKYIYSVLFFLLLGFVAHSQTLRVSNSTNQNTSHADSLWFTQQEYIEHVYGNLNMSEVTTNFLIQRSLNYFEPLAHDGKFGNDSTVRSFNEGMQLYNTLYYSALDTAAGNGLLHPSVFYTQTKLEADQGYIPLVLINRSYHSITQNALLSGLLSTNGDSTVLYDVPNRSSSPYEKHRLFTAFHTFEGFAYHSNGDVKFKIVPTSFNFTDTVAGVLDIDFGDGNGYVTVTRNSNKNITYTTSGIKTIKVKEDGLESSFNFNFFRDDVYFETENIVLPELESYRNITSGLSASMPMLSVTLGCDNILDKPILLVEGFEIESITSSDQILRSMNTYN